MFWDYDDYCKYLDSIEPDYEQIKEYEELIEEVKEKLEDFKGVDLESLSDEEYGKYEDLKLDLWYYKKELKTLKGIN